MLLLVQMMQSLTISLDACTALPVRRSHQGSSDFGWKLGFLDLSVRRAVLRIAVM